MTETGSDRRAEALDRQFQREHERIHEVARALAAARDLPELLHRLAVFRVDAAAHFRQEEGPGGFFEFVRSRSSANLHRIREIEREHEAFLAAIEQLDRRVRECLAGPVADLLREAGRMVEQFRRHEAAEGRLLTDVLYADSDAAD
jgi:hypothetical protein